MSDCIETHLFRGPKGYAEKAVGSRTDGTSTKRSHHRVVYAEHHGLDIFGPEMKGMDVDHTCFNRACINIEHLELVPHNENLRRSRAAGRMVDPPRQNPTVKLDPHAVRWIRSYVQGGRSQREVAEMFDMSQPQISKIVLRQSWKDVA